MDLERIKCFFGFHKWKVRVVFKNGWSLPIVLAKCKVCKRGEYRFKEVEDEVR